MCVYACGWNCEAARFVRLYDERVAFKAAELNTQQQLGLRATSASVESQTPAAVLSVFDPAESKRIASIRIVFNRIVLGTNYKVTH